MPSKQTIGLGQRPRLSLAPSRAAPPGPVENTAAAHQHVLMSTLIFYLESLNSPTYDYPHGAIAQNYMFILLFVPG
jgi:hypothetical protein